MAARLAILCAVLVIGFSSPVASLTLDQVLQQMQAAKSELDRAQGAEEKAQAQTKLEQAIQTYYQVYTRQNGQGDNPGQSLSRQSQGTPANVAVDNSEESASPAFDPRVYLHTSVRYSQPGLSSERLQGQSPRSPIRSRHAKGAPVPAVEYNRPPASGPIPGLPGKALPYIPLIEPPPGAPSTGRGIQVFAPIKQAAAPEPVFPRKVTKIHPIDPILPAPQEDALLLIRSTEKKMQFWDFAGALADINEAIAIDPFNPVAHLLRAQILCRLGRFEEAETAALESARLGPNSSTAYEVLAWAQLNLGKYHEAVASASQALFLDPKNAFAYAIRAYAQEQLGQEEPKLKDMEAAARLNPAAFSASLQNARAGKRLYPPSSSAGSPASKKPRAAPPVRILRRILVFGVLFPILGGAAYLAVKRRRRLSRGSILGAWLLMSLIGASLAGSAPREEDRLQEPGARQQEELPSVREGVSLFDPQWFDMGEHSPSAIQQARNVYKQIHEGEGSIDFHLKNAQNAICANQGCKADARQGPLLLDFSLPGRNALARAYNHLRQVLQDAGAGVTALKEAGDALEAAAGKNRKNAAALRQAAQGLMRFPAGIKVRPPSSDGDGGATQEALDQIQSPEPELRRVQEEIEKVGKTIGQAQASFKALQEESHTIEAQARKAGESHANSLTSLGDDAEGGPSYMILRAALEQLSLVRTRIAKVLAAAQATIQEIGRTGVQVERTAAQTEQSQGDMASLLDKEREIHGVFPQLREAWDRGEQQVEGEAQVGKKAAFQIAGRAAQPTAAAGGCKGCAGALQNIMAAFGDTKEAGRLPILGPMSLSITSSGSAEGVSLHHVTFRPMQKAVESNSLDERARR